MYDPYKWLGAKPFFAKFKSGGLDVQHDCKNGKKEGDPMVFAHKAKFKCAGLNEGDRCETITTDKDHEQKYWFVLPGLKHDAVAKVQGKFAADGSRSGAVALMAGGYPMGDFQMYSHLQVEAK